VNRRHKLPTYLLPRSPHGASSLEKYVSNVSATCFRHLHQLRHIRRSLSTESATTLVHTFVTSRIDYCNAVYVGAPKSVTGKLQRVLNAAARVVSGTRKFDHGLTQLLHANLHCFDVPECIKYKLCMMMRRCQDGTAPQYLAVHWSKVSETALRQHLRSAASHQLTVSPHRRTTYGGRAFAVAGPLTWNSLPKRLRDPSSSSAVFACLLKTFLLGTCEASRFDSISNRTSDSGFDS